MSQPGINPQAYISDKTIHNGPAAGLPPPDGKPIPTAATYPPNVQNVGPSGPPYAGNYSYGVPVGAPNPNFPAANAGNSNYYGQPSATQTMPAGDYSSNHPVMESDYPNQAHMSKKERRREEFMSHARWHTRAFPNRWFERVHSLRVRYRDYLAEFFGTAVLVFLGDAAGATVTLWPDAAFSSPWLIVCFGWGLALTIALFISGGISGGHLNPAVTFTAGCLRGFPWRKVPGYIACQLVGAFVGAGFVFALFHSSIHHFDGGIRQTTGPFATAGIFATYPKPWITVGTGFLAEAICTAVLLFGIYAITDERNMPGTRYAPIAIGLVITAIGICLGFQTGFAVNPARDLGPRAFTSAAGYGSEPWIAHDRWAWVPCVAPFVGGLIGGFLYDFFANHPRLSHDDDDDDKSHSEA